MQSSRLHCTHLPHLSTMNETRKPKPYRTRSNRKLRTNSRPVEADHHAAILVHPTYQCSATQKHLRMQSIQMGHVSYDHAVPFMVVVSHHVVEQRPHETSRDHAIGQRSVRLISHCPRPPFETNCRQETGRSCISLPLWNVYATVSQSSCRWLAAT